MSQLPQTKVIGGMSAKTREIKYGDVNEPRIQCMSKCPIPIINPRFPQLMNQFELCVLECGHEGSHVGYSGEQWRAKQDEYRANS